MLMKRNKQKNNAADIDNLTAQWEKEYLLNPVAKYYLTAEYMQISENFMYYPVYIVLKEQRTLFAYKN